MSAHEEGGRDPPKPKGKTLGSFLGSLPGFSSARNLMASAHSSAKEAQPVTDPAGASAQPQTEAATNLEQTAHGEKLPPPSDKMTSGAKDPVCSKMTKTKGAISSGMANMVDTAKGVVQGGLGVTRSALTGTKETVATGVTGAVDVAKGTIQTGLNTTKTVLTGTKDAVSTGVTGAANMAKGTIQTGLDTTKTVLTGTKDTVCSGMTSAMNVAKGAVQTGMDTSKAILTGTKDAVSTGLTRAGSVATGTVQTVQNWLPGTQDSGLPSYSAPDKGGEQTILRPQEALSSGVSSAPDTLCTGLDLAREATAVATGTHGATLGREDAGHEGAVSFATLQDELGELGDIFHPMDAGEQARLAASEPEPKVLTADRGSYFVRLGDLAPGFRQRAFEHALSHLQHSQFQARAALAQLEDSFELVPGSGALSRACGLIQQLHVAYSTLASGLQGLPSELQQHVGQARHSLCELYGLVSSASSVEELPAQRLAQSRGAVGQAWQKLEQMLESVQHGPPPSWLVGPFALHPAGQQL
ncbi:perilipin-4 isoform X3 [Neomonachus schauinslandi]|uniref:Perilipin-4 isoform X3 n=1 Tax=Neomonachus schauinslandi TaxID=29088 RepID=A0A8M1MGQ6_NEOSC|nr:perilipin-4 isoform X3 [Neomonachus schauinslandi]